MPEASPVTRCLRDLRHGREGALERLIDLLYDDLRRVARAQLAQKNLHTLNPTALVHEAYLRLAAANDPAFEDRDHFFAVCSTVMRNITVDFARRRSAQKRGGDRERVTLDENVMKIDNQADDLLAIDQALTRMQALSPRMVRVVECRFFGGLTEPETAGALEISERTVRREWTKARALLREMLGDAG